MVGRLRRSFSTGPAPTIRLKLTVIYGVVFLITGAILLTIGYILVRHNLNARLDYSDALRKLGLPPMHHHRAPPGDQALATAVHAELRTEALHQLIADYLLALAAMTLVSVGAGWWLAGRALRPLREITATARRVSVENLGERIGLTGPSDELKELADTFDGMLGRLDSAFASQRHFVANSSHELRTPLAIMRTEVDVALADDDASIEELRGMGEAIRETIDRCERLIESLLMLARSEALTGREEAVDLAALAADCITDMRARAHDAQITMRLSLQPAWAHGEPHLLERMIANLIDNGIRHNVPGGFLEVSTEAIGPRVRVIVRNGGAVIPPASAAGLMEPFTRIDRARPGFGLGLSIVKSVAAAHGGEAVLSAPDDGGLRIEITVPGDLRAASAHRQRQANGGHGAVPSGSSAASSPMFTEI
jgi:signal transduction histidine kinase